MEETRQQQIRHDIPKGAIILTRIEALSHQIQLVRNWKPESDVWSLLYARPILSLVASLSGFYINQRFRAKLKLRNYGYFPTTAGLMTGPAIGTSLLYTELVQNKLFLLEVSCPLCLEIKSIVLQTCTSLFLPMILAPVANFFVAAGSGMYNVPHISDRKSTFKVISSIYKPLIPAFATIFVLQAFAAGFLTHLQIKSFLYVLDIQYLREEKNLEEDSEYNF